MRDINHGVVLLEWKQVSVEPIRTQWSCSKCSSFISKISVESSRSSNSKRAGLSDDMKIAIPAA